MVQHGSPLLADLGSALREQFDAPLCEILQRFADASASLRELLDVAPLSDLIGATGEMNPQGEATAKLDRAANALFVRALQIPGVAFLVSEEEPDPIHVGDGRYTCCFDPLDGSSNIGIANVGSIIGIYEGVTGFGPDSAIAGRQLAASAFTVYGVPTTLIVASANRVDGFSFDPRDRSWRLTTQDIRLPKPRYASVNWMYKERWSDEVRSGVDAASAHLSGRYSGSLVQDILRVLMSGGIFLYPEDAEFPTGKLRMLYEICPIGFAIEAAGGAAEDGKIAVLDVPITRTHQRGPMIVGDRDAVLRYHDGKTGQG